MDETEKYKQRLEAIAERRRQQDEQDRAKREMEDEKLRVQQMKRKSLRDQWLMEGTPLSPTSPDAHSPRSPLWSSQAKEIEKLQSEGQQLAEEKEKEQMEDGQTQEAVKVAEAGAEMVQDVVVQNGEKDVTVSETTADEVQTNQNQSALPNEPAVILTNGGGDFQANTSHEATESNENGPIHATEGSHVPDVNINQEEEEETLVIRAERIIIIDEGDCIPEDLSPREDQQEAVQSEETPLPHQEAGNEEGEAVDEEIITEIASETVTQLEENEATEEQPANGDRDVGGETNTNGDGQTEAEGQEKQTEDSTSVQSPATALEGTTVASVPVYSEGQPSTLVLNTENEATTSPEGAEVATKDQDAPNVTGHFQEVPLADPQENQRTEAGPGEQEPLLSQAKVPNTEAEQAAANRPANTNTHSPTRANQGEETEAPKRKTCQCCTVM